MTGNERESDGELIWEIISSWTPSWVPLGTDPFVVETLMPPVHYDSPYSPFFCIPYLLASLYVVSDVTPEDQF